MTLIALGRPELVEAPDVPHPNLVARYNNGDSALWGLPGSTDLAAARCYRKILGSDLNLVGHILVLECPKGEDEGTVYLQRHRVVGGTIKSESIRIGWSDCAEIAENPGSRSRLPNIDLVGSVIHAVRGGRRNSDPFANPQATSKLILDRIIALSTSTEGQSETTIHPTVVAIARALKSLQLVPSPPFSQQPA